MNDILDEIIMMVEENIELEGVCRQRECEAYVYLPDDKKKEIKQTFTDIIRNLDQHRITIYTTEEQIHRMNEVLSEYENGMADAEDLYSFLSALKFQNRDLTYLEENMTIIGRGREDVEPNI